MTLKSTSFHDAVDYKIVVDQDQTAVVVQQNVGTAPGRLFSIVVDCTQTVVDHYVKLYDGTNPVAGNTIPDFTLKGTAGLSITYQIPYGMSFEKLNFWITQLKAQTDTTAPAAKVTLTLVLNK